MQQTLTSVHEWQRLRLIARGGNEPVAGQKLRIDWARRTKDGTFLDDMVERGLLEVVTPGEVEAAYPYRPAQFQATYRLTEQGLHAAEYGEYAAPEPRPLPVWDGTGPRPLAAGAAPAKRGR